MKNPHSPEKAFFSFLLLKNPAWLYLPLKTSIRYFIRKYDFASGASYLEVMDF